MTKFNLPDEIRRATEAYFATIGIEIPASIRKPRYGDKLAEDAPHGKLLDNQDEAQSRNITVGAAPTA